MSDLLSRRLGRFVRDNRGGIAVIFALAAVPLLISVGCAVDYATAVRMRAKMQAAADAASVGSVARNSRAYVAAGTMSSDGPIPDGVNEATQIFNGNMVGQTDFSLQNLTATVVKASGVITSTVTFQATVPTSLLGMVGKTSLTIGGSSVATSSMPLYIDFYLLLDNSPSMGVAATPADVTKMVNNTSDQCAFACHDLSDSNNYYQLAKKLGVTTRIDVLRSATQQLMDTAAMTAVYPNQFRMALYDFGGSSSTASLRSLFSLSSSLSSAKTAAGNIDLMTVNYQNENDDRDTNYSDVFPDMNNAINTPGSGTSSAPLKYLFFVSDGVADETNGNCSKTMKNGYWGNKAPRCQSPIDPKLCQTLKDRGIKVAVLYTTYLALPLTQGGNPSWYGSWIAPFNAGPYGPSVNSEIAINMKACASPGYYFEVSPTDGIADAMNALFQKAVANARISK